jgi:hypothetical protein
MNEKKTILFIKENYTKYKASFIAQKLGITTDDVYKIVRQQGLKKHKKDTAPRKPKQDIQVNPTQEIPAPPAHDGELIPLRIDARTIILIPPDVDPEKRRAEFLRKINGRKTHDINTL